jgi:hypothetical protein
VNDHARRRARAEAFQGEGLQPDIVPRQGGWRNPPSAVAIVTGQRLPAARKALGTTPLWLGRSFEGHRLASVVVGVESLRAPKTGLLRPTRFARFDYGAFAVHEYEQDRPFANGQEPTNGRDGLLVIAELQPLPIGTSAALALAKALRPVPGG